MDKKILVFAVAAAVVFSLANSAFGFGATPGGRHIKPEKMFDKIAKDIGLTDQQKDKFITAAKQTEEKAREIRQKNKTLFAEIEKELSRENPDRNVIHRYLKQIGENDYQIQVQRMDQMIDLRKSLTPDQKQKFEKLMQEKRERNSHK